MKYIYFGSSEFSKITLEGLCREGLTPSLVVSRPDKPKGRGLKVFSTDVSAFCLSKNMPLINPETLDNQDIQNRLCFEDVDYFIVSDYGKIIPATLLSIPKVFSLCVHPSLLPKYRGPTPIETALINGEEETGVTIFKVSNVVDSGEIILKKKVSIDDADDFFSLRDKLVKLGSMLLFKAIMKIEAKSFSLTPQSKKSAILTSKFKKSDGRIKWASSSKRIRNLIRATLHWPTAYTFYKDLMVKVSLVDEVENDLTGPAGTVLAIDKEGIYVASGRGVVKIRRIKPQGKSEMDAWSFVCGHEIKIGDKFH